MPLPLTTLGPPWRFSGACSSGALSFSTPYPLPLGETLLFCLTACAQAVDVRSNRAATATARKAVRICVPRRTFMREPSIIWCVFVCVRGGEERLPSSPKCAAAYFGYLGCVNCRFGCLVWGSFAGKARSSSGATRGRDRKNKRGDQAPLLLFLISASPLCDAYCSNVPFSSGVSCGITTAAATLSPPSRCSRRTPCVDRPASRICLVSMRMILP